MSKIIYTVLFTLNFSIQSQVNISQSINDTIIYYGTDWTPRVVKGWPAAMGDVPYQVGFKQLKSRSRMVYTTFCGGVIIAPSKLVSAAHCFEGNRSPCGSRGGGRVKQRIFAVAGYLWNDARYSRDTATPGQWRRVVKAIFPADYRFPKKDIAVVYVRGHFQFNNYVSPIPFASSTFINYQGICLVSGYGRISSRQRSTKLLLAHLQVLSASSCSRLHRRNMNAFICTSSVVSDIAKGDSGGPLVCKNTGDPFEADKGVLVGIVSGQRLRVGSFFTRVSTFSNYIQRGGCVVSAPNLFISPIFLIFITGLFHEILSISKYILSMYKVRTIFVSTLLYLNILSCFSQIFNASIDNSENDWVPRVVNGKPAALGDVPYQVALKTRVRTLPNTYSTFCGATIIGPTKLISAAHCFASEGSACCGAQRKKNSNAFAVAANLNNAVRYDLVETATSGQWRKLKSIAYPRKYRFPKADIAVLFTTEPFIFNSHVGEIPYASKFSRYTGECIVSGYGRISPHQHSSKLLWASLAVISESWCSRIHGRNMRHFICTSNRVSDIAKGDSGGPLVCKNTGDPAESDKGLLVGVVSGHRRRAGSFFTRVSSFTNYIRRGGCASNRSDIFLMTTIFTLYLIKGKLLPF